MRLLEHPFKVLIRGCGVNFRAQQGPFLTFERYFKLISVVFLLKFLEICRNGFCPVPFNVSAKV